MFTCCQIFANVTHDRIGCYCMDALNMLKIFVIISQLEPVEDGCVAKQHYQFIIEIQEEAPRSVVLWHATKYNLNGGKITAVRYQYGTWLKIYIYIYIIFYRSPSQLLNYANNSVTPRNMEVYTNTHIYIRRWEYILFLL